MATMCCWRRNRGDSVSYNAGELTCAGINAAEKAEQDEYQAYGCE